MKSLVENFLSSKLSDFYSRGIKKNKLSGKWQKVTQNKEKFTID